MRFHILVKNQMGTTSTVHVCTECAAKSPHPPLREPGTGALAGPVRTYEHDTLRCSQCGISDAATGYVRTCTACSRFYLLDHCDEAWPPPTWFCPRPACRAAELAARF
jgi:hypothetical protein